MPIDEGCMDQFDLFGMVELFFNVFFFSCSLHIRRTDKKSEAKYHGIDEYMEHVSAIMLSYDP